MLLRRWLGKRRLVQHADYLRDLQVAVLRKEVLEFGFKIDGHHRVTCAHCNFSECACDHARNDTMRRHRESLRNFHMERYQLIERHSLVIEDLEGRLDG